MPILYLFFAAWWLSLPTIWMVFAPPAIVVFCYYAEDIATYIIAAMCLIVAAPFTVLCKEEITYTGRYLP